MLADLWLAWWSGPWILLLLPLALRWLPLRGDGPETRWSWRIDAPATLGLGAGLALLFTAALVTPVADSYPLSASDFDHYCELVARVADGSMADFYSPRLPPPAWLPALLSHSVGVIDGLAIQSWLAVATCLGALYVWGFAVHGRSAGALAALVAGAVVPLAVMVRDLSFYPTLLAGVTCVGAAFAMTVRERGVWPAAALGLACGVTLLCDVRAVLYVAPVFALGLVVAPLRGTHWWGRGLRLLAVVLPVVVSWFVAGWVVSEATTGLEHQVAMYLEQAVRDAGVDPAWREQVLAPVMARPSFVWGHGSILGLPGTALALAGMGSSLPQELVSAPSTELIRREYVNPWLIPGAIAVVVVIVGLARRPWRLLALVGGALPSLAMLYSASTTLPQERHLAPALLPLPLLFGVFLAVVAMRGPSGEPGAGPVRWPWRGPLLWLAVLLGLLGVYGSWLSPVALWRRGVIQSEPRVTLQAVWDGVPPRDDHCCKTLMRQRDLPGWPSRLYPEARRVLQVNAADAP